MRFKPPQRHDVSPERFGHPAFASLDRHTDLLAAPGWPNCTDLNRRVAAVRHTITGQSLRFVEQTPALTADRVHYETRIHRDGRIATRASSWHDLLNALMWIEQPEIKSALNARQAADVDRTGPAQRTRGQCALTHFDEAGVVVLVRDAALMSLWDAHDWHGLLWKHRDAWEKRAEVVVIGHALLEHALLPAQLLVGKALVVTADTINRESALRTVAHGIAEGSLLRDPQELRPLPLSGLPGWHQDNGDETFHRETPCYRALRPGRVYPPPLRLSECGCRPAC